MKTVLENNLMGDQFFLTRQTANLLEDFTREIDKGSSLFLLYGIKSVGKSHLLRELTNRGIPGRKFCWIDFKTENVDSSIQNELSDADAVEVADERDIIIVDHFELASNKAKHQLFHSWTTEGINKKINLIVIATTDSDEIINLEQIPKKLLVIGGGVIGMEYATIFKALDIDVTILEANENLLEFVDKEIVRSWSIICAIAIFTYGSMKK